MSEFDWGNFYKKMEEACKNRDFPDIPLYENIRRTLQAMIIRGEFPDGCQLPSDRVLARELNINHITLGKAFNELRKCGLLVRSPAKGTFVRLPEETGGSPAEPFGRNLVSVIFDDVNTNTFQSELFVAIHNNLNEYGMEMLFASFGGDSEKQYNGIRSVLVDPDCRGCIAWSIMSRDQVADLLRIKPKNFPLIILNGEFSGLEFDGVSYDTAGALRQMAEYYLRKKFARMAYLVPHKYLDLAKARLEQLDALLPSRDAMQVIPYSEKSEVDFAGYRDVPLIAFNTSVLWHLYQNLCQSGIASKWHTPVAVPCNRSDLMPPLPLLKMIFPAEELGVLAVEALTARLNGNRGGYQKQLVKGVIHEPVGRQNIIQLTP